MPDKASDTVKAAIERAKETVDRRDDERDQVADKIDAIVREEGPKARERLAEAERRGHLKPH
jgi:hypothetical protein